MAGRNGDTDLFHENAKREIAHTYANMGEIEKAYKLYEGFVFWH